MKALILAMALGQTHAGATVPPSRVPTTKIIFGVETDYGARKRPDGLVIEAAVAAQFSGLIQVRSNFRREVLQSSGELK